MDIMDLIDNLDNFIIVNSNTLKYNGDKYTNYALYGSNKELTPLGKDYFDEKNITEIYLLCVNKEYKGKHFGQSLLYFCIQNY